MKSYILIANLTPFPCRYVDCLYYHRHRRVVLSRPRRRDFKRLRGCHTHRWPYRHTCWGRRSGYAGCRAAVHRPTGGSGCCRAMSGPHCFRTGKSQSECECAVLPCRYFPWMSRGRVRSNMKGSKWCGLSFPDGALMRGAEGEFRSRSRKCWSKTGTVKLCQDYQLI